MWSALFCDHVFIIFSSPSTQLKCTCELGYPKSEQQHLVDPRRMRRRVTVVVLSVCVCVCVCVLPWNLLHTSFIHRKQSVIGFVTVFQGFCRVTFAENASFKSYGIICWSLPPSSLPNDVSMDKRDSTNFFLTLRVCMSSYSSQNTTNSSLTGANCHASCMPLLHGTRGTAAYCAIACSVHCCGYSVDSLASLSCMHAMLMWFEGPYKA